MRIVVAGVAGSGKSTVGAALAERLDAHFVDGDSLHPETNIAKMSTGQPLDDTDRWPWLDAIVDAATVKADVVVACSALALRYRDRLRQIPNVRIVFLELDQPRAIDRVTGRSDHFMSAAMVASQFTTLERPGPGEANIVTLDASADLAAVVDAAMLALSDIGR